MSPVLILALVSGLIELGIRLVDALERAGEEIPEAERARIRADGERLAARIAQLSPPPGP